MNPFHVDQLRDLAKRRGVRTDEVPRRRSGWLDAMTATHFRTLGDGRRVFDPGGACGSRAYVVSPEAELRLLARAKDVRLLTSMACVGCVVALGAWVRELDVHGFLALMGGLAGATWAVTRLAFWPLTRRLERVAVRSAPLARWRALGTSLSAAHLAFSLCVSAALGGFGFFVWVQMGDPKGLVLAALLLATGFAPSAIAAHARWAKRRRPLAPR